MKKIINFLVLFVLLFSLFPNNSLAKEEVTIHLFHLNTCPHCAKLKEYLKTLQEDYDLNVIKYEVSSGEKENNKLLDLVQEVTNTQTTSVPYTVIGKEIFVGFNSDIKAKIKNAIDSYIDGGTKLDIVVGIKNGSITKDNYSEVIQKYDEDVKNYKEKSKSNESDAKETTFNLPFFGEVSAKGVSLPLLAVVIGAIDGFNSCAMWVLLLLISMLFHMKNKKRMWALGIAFLVSSAIVYLLFMVAWLKIAISLTQVFWIRIGIALVALIGGAINLRSFYKERKEDSGCTVVDDKKRKKIFERIKKFTNEKSFILALIGVIVLAFSVNLVELACSAGLPLLFTQILALNDLNSFEYMVYILIYIFFFLIDDLVVFIVAMCTLKLTGITTKYNSWSHLIGGILMIIIGILLIFKPGILMFSF